MLELLSAIVWFQLSQKCLLNLRSTQDLMHRMYNQKKDNKFNPTDYAPHLVDAFSFYLLSLEYLNDNQSDNKYLN